MHGLVGTVIDGRYEVKAAVNEGGFAVVYHAVHRELLCWLPAASAFSGRHLVMVVQPTKDRKGADGRILGVLLPLGRNRDPLTDPLVRALPVEIAKRIGAEDMLEMAASENDDVVETLSPGTPEKPLAPGIHEGRASH